MPFNIKVYNQKAGRIDWDPAIANTFFGYQAGNANTIGTGNTANGFGALAVNTNGIDNLASGAFTLNVNTTGRFNTANGAYSLTSNTTGKSNTADGRGALASNQTGDGNTAGGEGALSNINGSHNTAFGASAGLNNTIGSGNVFLGYNAGYNEIGSNKLYIANSSTNPPLIYGDFSSGNVGINTIAPSAKLEVQGALGATIKIVDGSQGAGKVLTSDINGQGSWQTVASGGTVTSFSSGNLAPLFTASVTTAATTPALSFTISNAAAYTIYGNNTNASAAPAFFAPTLASALFQNQGNVNSILHGNASGNPSWGAVVNADITNGTIDLTAKVTGILPIANGGTNISTVGSAGSVIYSNGTQHASTAAGTAGQVLTSSGAGAPTWTTPNIGWTLIGNAGTTPSTSAIGTAIGAGQNYVGTTDAKDFIFGTNKLERMRITSSGNVGIGITPDASAALHVDVGQSTNGVLFSGHFDPLSHIADLGAGSRMMFYPCKAAFRAGVVTGTAWDDASLGYYSTATGYSTTASGDASIAMGTRNTAYGYASIAMGDQTTAIGHSSIALGYQTTANASDGDVAIGSYVSTNFETGAFILGDNSTSTTTNSSTSYEMTMRFAGGYRLFSNSGLTAGVTLAPGAGAWASVSDKRKKENFITLNPEEILLKIKDMPVTQWNYKAQDKTNHHIGPMAQDFYAAFKLSGNGNDTTITTSDIDGVNMIAIQALEKRTAELKSAQDELTLKTNELEKLKTEVDSFKNKFIKLENEMEAIQQRNVTAQKSE